MRKAGMAGFAALALLASQAAAQSVSYDYDRGADFTRIRTYAWARGTPIRDELNHKRIVAAIEQQLAARGLTRAEPGATPDALVAYHATFDTEIAVNGYSSEWGGPRWSRSTTGSARVQEVLMGTLAVEITDAGSRSLLWRGIAEREVDLKASPEKRDRQITRAAEKLFKHYPPKK